MLVVKIFTTSYFIRLENNSDIFQINNIHNQAFKNPDESQIVNELRKNNNLTLSLVCENNIKLIGHIAYSPILNECKEPIGVGLGPIGILPLFQKQGAGSQLIIKGNNEVIKLGFDLIFVLGDPKYYSKFGFKLAKDYNYFCDYDPGGNHFMVLESNKKHSQKRTVYYCDEFNV